MVQHSELLVDCAACGQQQPWAALAEGLVLREVLPQLQEMGFASTASPKKSLVAQRKSPPHCTKRRRPRSL